MRTQLLPTSYTSFSLLPNLMQEMQVASLSHSTPMYNLPLSSIPIVCMYLNQSKPEENSAARDLRKSFSPGLCSRSAHILGVSLVQQA